jgi:hypothetical protein
VYSNFINIIHKRSKLTQMYKTKGVSGNFKSYSKIKSILSQYYIFGKKKFSDL